MTAGAATSSSGGRTAPRIEDLAQLELDSSEAIDQFARLLQRLGHEAAIEVSLSADELQAALSRITSIGSVSAPLRARVVARHMRLAAEAFAAAAVCAVRFRESYRHHFAPEIDHASGKRRRGAKPFRFEES